MLRGEHHLEVALAGHATARRTISVHRGEPVDRRRAVPLAKSRSLRLAGAELALDGAPVAIEGGGIPVPPGAHALVARAPGFREQRIAIPAERPRDYALAVTLRPAGALLSLAGVPRGAQLVVDGVAVATAPLSSPVEVPPGAHTVEIRGRGFRPYRDRGTFAADDTIHLRVTDLRRTSHRRTSLAAAATGTFAALGAGLSYLALRQADAYDARAARAGVTSSDPALASMKSTGEHYALGADLSFGLAIAGAAVTTYLYLRDGRTPSRGTLHITGPGLAGRF
ncbi:MAG: PEGA domain-containing protein [Deltaproteobacteria bacterium]|nr:PEGA domain-containing protein [Deltaproteobacteria bacterium]